MHSIENLLALALSGATALCFAIGYVLQYHEAHAAPDRLFLSPIKMLVELAKHRLWVFGIVVMFIGDGLQAGALALGSLAVVEPILTTALLFALAISAAWRRERLQRRDWVGALCVSLGLGLLICVGSPTVGRTSMSEHMWVLVTLAVWGGALGMVAIARRTAAPAPKAAFIGGAAGVLFGLQDAMTRFCLHAMSHGFFSLAFDWQPYVSMVAGIYAISLMQSAYKAGPLTAALPPIAVGEPVAGMLIGVFALNEHLNASPAAITFELIGAVVMIVGTVMLGRSPIVCGAQHPSRLKQLEAKLNIEGRLQPVKEAATAPRWVRVRYSAIQAFSMFLIFRRGR